MKTLYKQTNGLMEFVHIETKQESLEVYQGTVGFQSEKEVLPYPSSFVLMMEELLVEEKMKQGYDIRNELELQYLLVSFETVSEEKRNELQDKINEVLMETGNGFCEGGDNNDGKSNLFVYVTYTDKALDVILPILEPSVSELSILGLDEMSGDMIVLPI